MSMLKKIHLKNYKEKISEFEITLPTKKSEDFNIIYTKQAGDEVIYIFYCGNLLYKLDSQDTKEVRTFDLLDDIKPISLEELEALNNE